MKQMKWFRKEKDFCFVPVVLTDDKAQRCQDAANVIERMVNLSREEYDRELKDEKGMSATTRKANVDQGKGMKFYQFKRYALKSGSPEHEKVIAVADRCTNQIQAKKQKS